MCRTAKNAYLSEKDTLAMSKLDYLTIIIVGVCLAAVVFIMFKVADLGKTKNPLHPATEQEQVIDNEESGVPEDAYTPPPAPAADEPAERSSQPAIKWEKKESDPAEDNLPEDQYEEPDAPPAINRTGDFLVLAGSFRLRSGAEAEVQRLQQLGYRNAEVTLFNNGAFAAVLVDRFRDLGKAEALVAELQSDHGVEAYVHERRGEN